MAFEISKCNKNPNGQHDFCIEWRFQHPDGWYAKWYPILSTQGGSASDQLRVRCRNCDAIITIGEVEVETKQALLYLLKHPISVFEQ